MKKSIKINNINKNWVIYFILLGLIIILRYKVLEDFAFKYTDSDQTIMWLGLQQYSKGIFHEPRFFGQAYNTMLEAILAIPLYEFGVPPYKALPIITSILALIPYIIISLFAFLKKSPIISCLILSIPLLLPIEYSLITSMPRGFVTGIFISTFGVIGLFYPKSKTSFLFSSLIAVIGYSVNSNAILISIPCLIYMYIENRKNKYFYILSSIGLVLGISMHLAINYFYVLNPYYNLHKIEMSYSFENLILSFTNLDKHFNDIMPIFWKSGFLVLLLFVIISVFLYRAKKYRESNIVILTIFVIISTLGLSKIHDGSNSIFFSYSRMYLSIPILLGISLSFFSQINSKKYFYLFFLIPFSCFLFNLNNIDKAIEFNIDEKKKHVVGIIEIPKLYEECNNLKVICNEYKIQLVIISNHWYYDFFNYGCPSCDESFPNTLLPSYERRTWRLIEDEKTIYKNILIIDLTKDFTKQFNIVKQIKTSMGYFIINNNRMPTIDLLDTLGIKYRKYK